jgi:hypothetical protein
MNRRTLRGAGASLLAAAAFLSAGAQRSVAAPDPLRVGFPSSDPVDGKFLSMPGKGMSAIVAPTHLSLGIPSSAGASPLVVEVFDGDTSGLWDKPGGAVTTYELFTDGNRDGSSMTLLASATDAQMVDDAWAPLYAGPQAPAAQAPSGHYFYRVVVSIAGDAGVLNAYKVAINGVGQISAVQNEFSVIGGVVHTARAPGTPPYDEVVTSNDPMPSLNPSAPNPLNTYDGTFSFKIHVASSGASVSLAEGDADHLSDSTAAVAAEAALAARPGLPGDGASGNMLGTVFTDYRPFNVGGPVRYTVTSPSGATLVNNTDPSGDAEYETLPTFDTSAVGFYTLRFHDVDMRNTLFVKPAFGVEVFSTDSTPVSPLTTGLGALRGTVFHDANGNGVKDAVETGVEGVAVDVVNLDTTQVTQVLTNAHGEYAAGVTAGSYVASPATGTQVDGTLATTDGGSTTVVTVQNGQTAQATTSGFVDPTNGDPELALVPECRGKLTHLGLDVELPADLTGHFVQVQYVREGTASLYDAVSFTFTGRFAQPVLGFNRNLQVVNCWVENGVTHVVVDTTTSNRGILRRELRPGDVTVLSSLESSDTGVMKPVCRSTNLVHGQVLGGESTVKSLR